MTPLQPQPFVGPSVRECANLIVQATEMGTRSALSQVMTHLDDVLPKDACSAVEIALAEILNNIVEHAYAGVDNGEIRVCACVEGSVLHLEVRDHGMPMPGLTVPEGQQHDLSVTREDLPEGGFGWMLIRTLARGLSYERTGTTSILRVDFDLGPT